MLLYILATIFKADNTKNRLKHEICLKLTSAPLSRKNKRITANKHMFKVAGLTTNFEYVLLYLIKIVFVIRNHNNNNRR